jgi:ADP-heptose:LPS heptosyltransferase
MSKKDGLLKRLEINLRKLSMKAFSSGKKPVLIDRPIKLFSSDTVSKVLIIRTDRIGDFIISTAILREIRNAIPSAKIDILLSRKNYGIQRAAKTFCDNVLLYDKNLSSIYKLVSAIRKKKYDLVIDLYDNPSATASLITSFSGALYKLGIDKSNSDIYTYIVPMKDKQTAHIIDRVANLLLPFDIDPGNVDLSPEYPLDADNSYMKMKLKNLRIGINLAGSSSESKYWGRDNHIEFLKEAEKEFKDAEFILFASAGYIEDLNYIEYRTIAKASPVTTSFDEYAAALSACSLIITPDTAAVHLASAFKIPCLALYEASESYITGTLWTPYKIPNRICKSYTGKLSDLSPRQVYSSFKELVEEIKDGDK